MIVPVLICYLVTPSELLNLDQAAEHRKDCTKKVFEMMNINDEYID
jgi:hypothetical protein